MIKMASAFSKELLKLAVARICSILGWQSIQGTPLEIMIDVLDKYLRAICKETKRNCELAGRRLPDVSDVHLALQQFSVSMQDVAEYMKNVRPMKFPHKVPRYPVACESHLNINKVVTL